MNSARKEWAHFYTNIMMQDRMSFLPLNSFMSPLVVNFIGSSIPLLKYSDKQHVMARQCFSLFLLVVLTLAYLQWANG